MPIVTTAQNTLWMLNIISIKSVIIYFALIIMFAIYILIRGAEKATVKDAIEKVISILTRIKIVGKP